MKNSLIMITYLVAISLGMQTNIHSIDSENDSFLESNIRSESNKSISSFEPGRYKEIFKNKKGVLSSFKEVETIPVDYSARPEYLPKITRREDIKIDPKKVAHDRIVESIDDILNDQELIKVNTYEKNNLSVSELKSILDDNNFDILSSDTWLFTMTDDQLISKILKLNSKVEINSIDLISPLEEVINDIKFSDDQERYAEISKKLSNREMFIELVFMVHKVSKDKSLYEKTYSKSDNLNNKLTELENRIPVVKKIMDFIMNSISIGRSDFK